MESTARGISSLMRLPTMTATAAAGALAVSGCGAGKTVDRAASAAKNAVDPVAQAADATQHERSAAMTVTLQATGGEPFAVRGGGVVSFSPAKARITMETPGIPGRFEEILDAGRLYLQLPADAREGLPKGKSWVRLDMDRITGGAFSQSMSANSDPTAQVRLLKTATDTKAVGHEAIHGVPTTHYRGTLDLRRAAQSSPPALRRLVRRTLRSMADERTPFEVWIDAQHRVRREHMVLATKATGGAPAERIAMTIEITRFDVDTSGIKPPADRDVYDATEQARRHMNAASASGGPKS